MESLIEFILAGQTEFTPEVLIRFVVFVLILYCLSSIAQSILSVGR